ncbi:Nuclear segregation protein BFR1, putative [Perkinsus marinus ATCC 50983]|uniref:Nuclear segregation protein BFR1, putative n=2 Tax=Perkinsus marinus (strain ATCC 50983 / TXsc) TaxID=423536 RepID=C5LYY3_PERM5|nr:Nuclear segregation protein BFR1, putative [Perkinsus marinus ATCC 50983]EEQ97992.1 Nuclear segregation protein BFR1, putative [Perkinsus marinus ATCC 50983]|eukprot:XP_002765275.1 Nuclear segregation protein BFR1, putative [Perkinsus marinus ATCC 50983]
MSNAKNATTNAAASKEKPSEAAHTEAHTRPQPVDRAYYEKKIDKLSEEIKGLQAKVHDLNEKIHGKSEGKDEFLRKRDLLKQQMDEQQKLVSDLETKRSKTQDGIHNKQTEGRQLRAELSSMQKKLGFSTEDQIDDKIAEIEYRMHTESLDLKKEKELMKQISELKQTKPQLKKFAAMKSASGEYDSTNVGPLKANLEDIKTNLNKARDERRKLHEQYSKLMDGRRKAMEGMSDIFEAREKLNKEIRAKYGQIKELRDERSAKISAYTAWVAEQKEKRAAREREEREARLAEEEKKRLEEELEKEKEIPYLAEIELVENTIKYCKTLAPEEKKEEAAAKADVPTIDGTMALVQKKDRVQNYYFAPTAQKKKGKHNKQGASQAAFKHGLDTLQLFSDMKVDAPKNKDDVPKCIEDLNKRLAEYKDLQKVEYENRQKRREAREAAAKAAAEQADETAKQAETTEATA